MRDARDTGQAAFSGSSLLDVVVAGQASMITRRRLRGRADSWFEGCFDLLLGWLAGCLLVECQSLCSMCLMFAGN